MQVNLGLVCNNHSEIINVIFGRLSYHLKWLRNKKAIRNFLEKKY